MKRREGKFVHASPRLSPNQIKAAPRLRETRARPIGRRVLPKTRGATPTPGRAEGRNRSCDPVSRALVPLSVRCRQGVNAIVSAEAGNDQPRCPNVPRNARLRRQR
jgi:hypothetical protein